MSDLLSMFNYGVSMIFSIIDEIMLFQSTCLNNDSCSRAGASYNLGDLLITFDTSKATRISPFV